MAALDGMRILDMTQYEAGTSCTQALAWLGADVVKVESPGRGDPGRGVDRNAEYFVAWNSNKRSVAINLRSEEGRTLLLEMLPKFDVFVENYGPGVMERLQLTYDDLLEHKPDIIYARLKGFGVEGPWSEYKCFDMVAQAAAGAFSITGDADGPPMRPGPTMGDAGTGVQMALSIAAAYIQKLTSGVGQYIEISMQEAMTYYLRTAMSGGRFGERAARRSGNGSSPNMMLYPCNPGGENDYVYVMAVTPPMWHRVLQVVGVAAAESTESAWPNADTRVELIEKIKAWTMARTKYEAMQELAEADIPASAVLSTQELYTNEHLIARGFVHDVDHPTHGKIKLLGWPPKMSQSEVVIQAAPQLGEHTQEVLSEELDVNGESFEQLVAAGIVG